MRHSSYYNNTYYIHIKVDKDLIGLMDHWENDVCNVHRWEVSEDLFSSKHFFVILTNKLYDFYKRTGMKYTAGYDCGFDDVPNFRPPTESVYQFEDRVQTIDENKRICRHVFCLKDNQIEILKKIDDRKAERGAAEVVLVPTAPILKNPWYKWCITHIILGIAVLGTLAFIFKTEVLDKHYPKARENIMEKFK
ncbi:hypothetical protein LCGC14_0470400 [marine sediment metagenome]|uniref:Uncharacterized protein n=1 Tax=marine sediment metagenome TaxID=412755 RepID=A0A0F9UZ74_9ZZZZ